MEQVLHQTHPLVRILLATALAAGVAACGPPVPHATPAPSADANTAARPIARRVVSLAPAFTETLIAIGAADAIVGIGRFDPEVPGRAGLPRLGDTFSVSLETVLALEPDLVLVASKGSADSLRPASSRLEVLAPPIDHLDDALAIVADLGRRTGHDREAAALAATIRAALDAAVSRARQRAATGGRAPKVLVVVQSHPLYVAGRTSFVAELLRAVGAENAVDDVEQPWPMLSEEAAVARAPDVILDASEGDNATEAGRAALLDNWRRFPSVPAVRDGRVLVIREDAIFRAGPRIPEALAKLESLIFPEDHK
ncbi:MAG: helical backbone metal receptor [Planctomycetes bacterium]|nr:helical backbone metal receptor [Planctomycetota bacterium]